MTGKGQNFIKRVVESVFAISLVLVFFVVLIIVFNYVFPEGSGLQFIFNQKPEEAGQGDRREMMLQVIQGEKSGTLAGDASWAATLVRARNSVKSKKANDIAWHSAREGMRLQNLDAVQTLEDSSASIRFDARNRIDLGENSLIVIRRLEKDLLFKEKRSYMVVVDGELRGRIGGSDDESDVYLEVETPNAVARLKPGPDNREGIEFKIDVLDDSSSSVTVYSGESEVEAQGEIVVLGDNQLTRIAGEQAPSEPVTLPEPARPIDPANDQVFSYRSLPPRVILEWEKMPGIGKYHLVLATDEDFTRVLINKRLAGNRFRHGNLHEGNYFWKVSSINAAGESRFGPTRRFALQQDQTPPALDVRFPAETVEQAEIEISGETEPDARVFISGVAVGKTEDGRFKHQLSLKRGINVVVVEAVDGAGNVTYQSQLINGKY